MTQPDKRLSVAVVVGTRPEAIKMAPVIKALQAAPWCRCQVIATAQHRQMLDQVFELFDIDVSLDLDVMQQGQTLPKLTARLFERLDSAIEAVKPDFILAQGDTTTVLVAAMIAFYHKIPFGHVEAGLRTHDLSNPFPEEMNRVLVGRLASAHFAPTEGSANALRAEGVAEKDILVTGNTVIDALLQIAAEKLTLPVDGLEGHRVILLTAHRRENFGAPIQNVFRAVNRLLETYPDLHVIYPVHPNPNVRQAASDMFGQAPRVHLLDPLDYSSLVAVLKVATLVLTDSGGIQEEAPALGKPVLVLREETERPEAVMAGVAKLVGTDEDTIVREASRLLDSPEAYEQMARAVSPYGDGRGAERIVNFVAERFARKI